MEIDVKRIHEIFILRPRRKRLKFITPTRDSVESTLFNGIASRARGDKSVWIDFENKPERDPQEVYFLETRSANGSTAAWWPSKMYDNQYALHKYAILLKHKAEGTEPTTPPDMVDNDETGATYRRVRAAYQQARAAEVTTFGPAGDYFFYFFSRQAEKNIFVDPGKGVFFHPKTSGLEVFYFSRNELFPGGPLVLNFEKIDTLPPLEFGLLDPYSLGPFWRRNIKNAEHIEYYHALTTQIFSGTMSQRMMQKRLKSACSDEIDHFYKFNNIPQPEEPTQ